MVALNFTAEQLGEALKVLPSSQPGASQRIADSSSSARLVKSMLEAVMTAGHAHENAEKDILLSKFTAECLPQLYRELLAPPARIMMTPLAQILYDIVVNPYHAKFVRYHPDGKDLAVRLIVAMTESIQPMGNAPGTVVTGERDVFMLQVSSAIADLCTIIFFILVQGDSLEMKALPPSTREAFIDLVHRFNTMHERWIAANPTLRELSPTYQACQADLAQFQGLLVALERTSIEGMRAAYIFRPERFLPWTQCALARAGKCRKSMADEGTALKGCSKCMSVSYCCVEHQREDWPYHKKMCFATRDWGC